MKISLKWLNDYVDVSDYFSKPEDFSKLLTQAGLEVEGFEDLARPFQKVVVGEVVELGKHPNADKLTLCQVDVGDGQHRQIVCGAKNHRQKDKVVVALVGALLPGEFAIKPSKIRDVESQGMMCSESELGLSKESEGIMILPKEAKVGTPFAEYSGREDIVFEINVTPNRADCLSHIGLAREVSCLLDRKLKDPDRSVLSGAGTIKKAIDVRLEASEACPRYAGRLIKGVKIASSPEWLKNRLEVLGLNSINNVVDITNYVMMEYGQPLHAFDLKDLASESSSKAPHQISIAFSKGENFKALDEEDYQLTSEDLTIRDGQRAVALAGVIGGLNSGVADDTKDLFIESAHFNPQNVRRTSRRLGIDTDSSYRFSRGTDPEGVVEAMNRACHLIQKIAGGKASDDHYDLYPKRTQPKLIEVRERILNERLGYFVKIEDFVSWMKRLHCQVDEKSKASGKEKSVKITPPSFRWDLEIEMDLVEEYARLHGYDQIPEAFPPLMSGPASEEFEFSFHKQVANILSSSGYFQAVNYAFLNEKWQKEIFDKTLWGGVGLKSTGESVPVMNPLSEETGHMRLSLIPGLLTNLSHNIRHGNSSGRIFELGRVFEKESSKKESSGKSNSYFEKNRLALVAWGRPQSIWGGSKRPVIYDVKSALENLVSRLQGSVEWRSVKELEESELLHAGQSMAAFYQGKLIGFIGTLHPAFCDEQKIRMDSAIAEMDLDSLALGQPRNLKIKKISKFPSVERDLSLLVPEDLHFQDLKKEIQKIAGKQLKSVQVFDLFQGAGVPDGHRAIAFKMIFQSEEGTFSDDQLNKLFNGVIEGLTKKFEVKVR